MSQIGPPVKFEMELRVREISQIQSGGGRAGKAHKPANLIGNRWAFVKEQPRLAYRPSPETAAVDVWLTFVSPQPPKSEA